MQFVQFLVGKKPPDPRPGRSELQELSSKAETLDLAPETPLRNFSYLLVPWWWIGWSVTGETSTSGCCKDFLWEITDFKVIFGSATPQIVWFLTCSGVMVFQDWVVANDGCCGVWLIDRKVLYHEPSDRIFLTALLKIMLHPDLASVLRLGCTSPTSRMNGHVLLIKIIWNVIVLHSFVCTKSTHRLILFIVPERNTFLT